MLIKTQSENENLLYETYHSRQSRESVVLSRAQIQPVNGETLRGDIKIPSVELQTFHKMLQNHLRGSVTQSVIFVDVSQN